MCYNGAMGNIVPFRPRRKEGDIIAHEVLPAQSSATPRPPNPIEIPSLHEALNDDAVLYGGIPVTEYRRGIDITTPEGKKQRIRFEIELMVTRAQFIGKDIPRETRLQVALTLGKRHYETGLELNDPLILDQTRDFLISYFGMEHTARIIQNIRIRREINERQRQVPTE